MSNNVTQLPPTITVNDSSTRVFLDALVNVLEMRSGNIDKNSPDRFITLGDLTNAASARSGNGSGIGAPANSLVQAGNPVGDALQEIRNSLVYQILQQPIELINTAPIQARIDQALQTAQTGISAVSNALTDNKASFTLQMNSAVSRIGDAEAGLILEASTRATSDSAITTSLDLAVSRVGAVEGAILTENTTRATKDSALASAINTMWAEIGGGQALIQDTALAQANTVAVQASKWTQLQAAVTDPNTGLVSSTSIKQDLQSYASKVDGTLKSIYSVRAQVTQDGKTVIGGFGLTATQGAGSTAGPLIDFAVAADRFSVVNPSGNNSALVWVNGALTVYDESGNARVKIGKLS